MPKDTTVQIFWDYENIRFPSKYDAAPALDRLRDIAHSYGVLSRAAVYVETALERSNRSTELRHVLQSTGWHIIDTPHAGKKDVVDKMIMVDMCSVGFLQKSPVIVLITADRDYAYACSTLRNHRCRIILITTSSAAPVLRQSADQVLDWHRDVLHLPLVPSASTSSATIALPRRQQPARIAAVAAHQPPVAASSAPTSGKKKGKAKKAKAGGPDIVTLSDDEDEDNQSPQGALPPIIDLTLSSTSSQRIGSLVSAAIASSPNEQPALKKSRLDLKTTPGRNDPTVGAGALRLNVGVPSGGRGPAEAPAPPPPLGKTASADESAGPRASKKRRRNSSGDEDDVVIVQ